MAFVIISPLDVFTYGDACDHASEVRESNPDLSVNESIAVAEAEQELCHYAGLLNEAARFGEHFTHCVMDQVSDLIDDNGDSAALSSGGRDWSDILFGRLTEDAQKFVKSR